MSAVNYGESPESQHSTTANKATIIKKLYEPIWDIVKAQMRTLCCTRCRKRGNLASKCFVNSTYRLQCNGCRKSFSVRELYTQLLEIEDVIRDYTQEEKSIVLGRHDEEATEIDDDKVDNTQQFDTTKSDGAVQKSNLPNAEGKIDERKKSRKNKEEKKPIEKQKTQEKPDDNPFSILRGEKEEIEDEDGDEEEQMEEPVAEKVQNNPTLALTKRSFTEGGLSPGPDTIRSKQSKQPALPAATTRPDVIRSKQSKQPALPAATTIDEPKEWEKVMLVLNNLTERVVELEKQSSEQKLMKEVETMKVMLAEVYKNLPRAGNPAMNAKIPTTRQPKTYSEMVEGRKPAGQTGQTGQAVVIREGTTTKEEVRNESVLTGMDRFNRILSRPRGENNLVTLHFKGIRRCQYGEVRAFLKEECGMNTSTIINVTFVGGSVMELIVVADNQDEIISRLAEKDIVLIKDFNPLDVGLMKGIAVVDESLPKEMVEGAMQRIAKKRYISRVENMLKSIPEDRIGLRNYILGQKVRTLNPELAEKTNGELRRIKMGIDIGEMIRKEISLMSKEKEEGETKGGNMEIEQEQVEKQGKEPSTPIQC